MMSETIYNRSNSSNSSNSQNSPNCSTRTSQDSCQNSQASCQEFLPGMLGTSCQELVLALHALTRSALALARSERPGACALQSSPGGVLAMESQHEAPGYSSHYGYSGYWNYYTLLHSLQFLRIPQEFLRIPIDVIVFHMNSNEFQVWAGFGFGCRLDFASGFHLLGF